MERPLSFIVFPAGILEEAFIAFANHVSARVCSEWIDAHTFTGRDSSLS